MSKYKKIMLQRGIMQKEVLEKVRKTDPRVDSPLLSKITNDICLPTPQTLDSICKALVCGPLDIYDPTEITLAPPPEKTTSAEAAKKRARRRDKNLYNLTVEIPRDVAERVFAPEALRKLGYLSKSDFVRQAVAELDRRLAELEKNAADK